MNLDDCIVCGMCGRPFISGSGTGRFINHFLQRHWNLKGMRGRQYR